MARVLLVKLGAIGDAVMLLPAAKALHHRGDEVTWMCGQAIAPLLALYPWLRTMAVEERALLAGGAAERARAAGALWRRLAGERFDLIATLYYDKRYRLLTRTARAGRRLALAAGDRSRTLLPERRHTDEYARLLLGLADTVRPEGLAPVPPPAMPASPLGRTEGRTRVVLVPGGARNLLRDDALRRWPVESFSAVARALLARGCEVVLSGGRDDGWVLPAFAGLAVIDAIGRYSIPETLGLMDGSDAVVTSDTGPLHLAGLTSAAVVAIFGPTNPHGRIARRAGVVALWGGEQFACRPCYDGRNYALCPNNACVREITPAMVVGTLDELLAARRNGAMPAARVVVASAFAEELAVPVGAPGREA